MIVQNKIYGLMGLCARAGKIVSGADACIEEIKLKKIFLLILAKDASEKTKSNIKYECSKYNIEVQEYGDIINLSKSIGKENRAIIGIKDKNFSNEIKKMICGGEN